MIGPYPAPGAPPAGGIEAVGVVLVGALRRLGLDVITVTADPDGGGGWSGDANGWRLHHDQGHARLSGYWPQRKAISAKIEALRPDVVHVQGMNFYAPAALAQRVAPTLVTAHGILAREASITDPTSGWRERASKRLRGLANHRFEDQTLQRAHDVVIISPYVGEALRGRTSARFHPVPNPVPEQFYEVARCVDAPTVLFVGALEPRKDVLTLVKAFEAGCAGVDGACLHVIGKPVDRAYAEAVRSALAPMEREGRARYLGVVSDEQLLDEYARASVLSLPSREESSPMVVQQAMASGVPVVASRAGGISRLVNDGTTGLLVAPGDVVGLGRALRRLLEDPALASEMGRAAGAGADRFHPASVAAATARVYEAVTSGRELAATPAR